MAEAQKVLRECCGQQGLTADASAPVLKDVKVLGLSSLNKRRYTPEAIRKAIALYEGRRVNIDHPTKPNEPRSLGSRFGILKGVHEDTQGGGLRARELHFNPAHPMAATVKWWAENDPSALGLSHDAVGRGKDVDGTFVVEEIIEVRAVDLVADPATTRGLHEGATMPDPLLGDMGGGAAPAPPVDGAGGLESGVEQAVVAILKDGSLDNKAKLKKIGMALKLLDEDSPADAPAETPTEEQVRSHPAYRAIAERVDRLETGDKLARKATLAERLIGEAKLPPEAVTPLFRQQLLESSDEAGMKALIEDRRKLTGVQRPKSAAAGSARPAAETDEQLLERLGVR